MRELAQSLQMLLLLSLRNHWSKEAIRHVRRYSFNAAEIAWERQRELQREIANLMREMEGERC